jgi:hypothetical protein
LRDILGHIAFPLLDPQSIAAELEAADLAAVRGAAAF